MRHIFLEWITKNKRATFGSTLRPFQSVELSLHWLLPSRANVRFTQQNKFNQLTQFIKQTRPRGSLRPLTLSYASARDDGHRKGNVREKHD